MIAITLKTGENRGTPNATPRPQTKGIFMRLPLLALPLLLLGCSVNNGTIGGSFQTGDASYSSNESYDVNITQTAHPMSVGRQENAVDNADVSFDIEFTNRSDRPVSIKRISLQSMGGSLYRLETSSREFKRDVAPGEKTVFKYWAKAVTENRTIATNAPLVVRALIDTEVDGSEAHETFNREVNRAAVVGIGTTGG